MISHPTDPDALGSDPLPDPSYYLKDDYLGKYQFPVNSALAYVTQDGVADATPVQFGRIAKQSLLKMLDEHPVPAPVPGSAPIAWVLIKLAKPRRAVKRGDDPASEGKLMRDLREARCI